MATRDTDLHQLEELVSQRAKAQRRIRALQDEMQHIELQTAEYLIHEGMVQFISVNWRRLARHLGQPHP